MMQVDYKNHRITYRETENDFRVDADDDLVGVAGSLKLAKAMIDNLTKKELKGVFVLYSSWNEDHQKCAVTSVNDAGDVWIKNANGRREKIRTPEDLPAWTAANVEKVARIKKMRQQVEKIEDEMEKIVESMTKFDRGSV